MTPIRCVVIQLARLGDTLQSLMALRAAKELYPNLEIHFVARERFAAAAKRVSWIEKVITLPTDKILGPVLRGTATESHALRELARWMGPLVDRRWDLVVNWSYSEASSFLTGLLPAKVKLGYSRHKDTSFLSTDGWSHYIQAIVQGSIPQTIHLTDILTTQLLTALQIHYGEPAGNGSAQVTSRAFFTCQLDSAVMSEDAALGVMLRSGWSKRDVSKRWIAIQLGAAQEGKTWSPENWARLATLIQRKHPECRFVLLGGREEKPLATRFYDKLAAEKGSAAGTLNLVGQTDFDLWTAVLGGSQWLFSGDTAAVHLASILGTRVLNVSVGPVRWAETGPYGNGHYVVSSALSCEACAKKEPWLSHSCRDTVSPEAVYGTWSYASTEWSHRKEISLTQHFADQKLGPQLETVRVHRSKIRSTDDGGGVTYESMIDRRISLDDWTGRVIEGIARSWYCGWAPEVGQELSREMVCPDLIRKLRELEQGVEVLGHICRRAEHTAADLERLSASLKSGKLMSVQDRTKLSDLASALEKLDSLIDRLAKTHPPLEAFAQMSKVLMHNLCGDDLTTLGREAALCYAQLKDGAAICHDWVKQSLELARPKAVAVSTCEPHPSI